MLKKIPVKICAGTTCYVMGASDLLTIEYELDAPVLEYFEITAAPCLDLCKSTENGRPPFVIINGEVIASANLEKIKSYILKLYEKLKGE